MTHLELISQARNEGRLGDVVRLAVAQGLPDHELITLCGQVKRRATEILAETKYWQVEEI